MEVYKFQRSRSFTDLCLGWLRFSIFIFFSAKTAGLIEAELHVQPLWDEAVKIYLWDWSHMTGRWPPCPYMVKTLKNLLLRNQMANDLKTWFTALGTWAYQFVQMGTFG